MNKIIKTLILTALCCVLTFVSLANIKVFASENISSLPFDIKNSNFADDRIMIVLNKDASFESKEYSKNDFEAIGCKNVKDLTSEATKVVQNKKNNRLVDVTKYNRVLCLELNKKSKSNVINKLKLLLERDDVAYAGPDYLLTTDSVCVYPNDSEYTTEASKWAITDLNLNYVWNLTTGSNDVVVGVIDTGINGEHPDLDNTYVSSLCRDFTTGVENGIAENIPSDPGSHGSHVAGIIGAEGNNSIGVAGVCWNVGLASLKSFSGDHTGYASHVASAINFAEANDIPILNLSARWYNGENYDYALDSVISSYSGLIVCSAGNEARNNDNVQVYPANYGLSNLISVGALDEDGDRAYFSNYGQNTVDIYAPGSNILSTYENGYYSMSGTSMAAPFVSGVAALLLSMDSSLTSSQLKSIILGNSQTTTITLPNGTTQNVNKLNVIRAVRGVLNLNAFPLTISTSSVTRSEIIKPNSSNYFDYLSIIKLEVSSNGTRSFEIISSREVEVTIYDSSLGSLLIYKTYSNNNRTITFDRYLYSGSFYIKTEYPNSTTNGTIEVNIDYVSSD